MKGLTSLNLERHSYHSVSGSAVMQRDRNILLRCLEKVLGPEVRRVCRSQPIIRVVVSTPSLAPRVVAAPFLHRMQGDIVKLMFVVDHAMSQLFKYPLQFLLRLPITHDTIPNHTFSTSYLRSALHRT
jgi:hypothetical protein